MVPLREVLADRELDLRPIHLPTPEARVRWVAASELADPTPFLEGGELLLVTGLETRGWRSQWNAYVDRLVARGVVALGVGTGLTYRAVPAALVRACERAGLNLCEIPPQTTFVAVSRTTARLVEEGEAAEARSALAVHRELTQAALGSDAPAHVITALARLVEGAACLVSGDGDVLAGPSGPASGRLDVPGVLEEVERIRPQGLRASSAVSSASGTTVVQPIGLSGRPSSYVGMLVAGRVTDVQRSALTTAVSLLSLAEEQGHGRRKAERLLRTRAIELLLTGDPATAEVVLSVSEGAIRLPARLKAVRARGDRESVEDALTFAERRGHLAALLDDELCVATQPAQAMDLARALAARGLTVGVGEATETDAAARSHETAGHALAQAGASAHVVDWQDVVGAGALALIDDDRARAFADAFLSPLDGDQVETLECFLRHHGSRLKTAEELGVHRNTVANRLAAIESLLDGSLDEPRVRVNAWIALQVGGWVTALGPRPYETSTDSPVPAGARRARP